MTTSTTARVSNRTLWFGILGGPAAWSIDELSAFSWHEDYCAAHFMPGFTTVSRAASDAILIVIGVLMLAVALAALVTAWRARAAVGDDDGQGPTVLDRQRFMATAGIWMSVLFAYGILLRVVTPLIVNSNYCGR